MVNGESAVVNRELPIDYPSPVEIACPTEVQFILPFTQAIHLHLALPAFSPHLCVVIRLYETKGRT